MNTQHAGTSRLVTVTLPALMIIMMCTACMPPHGGTSKPSSPGYCLTIRQYPAMTVLATVPITGGKTFSLSFIHSVTLTPVQDIYEITSDGGICQTSEIFESHCAGLPFSEQETGATKWEQRDGKFILHMKRDIPKLVVRTDRTYQNTACTFQSSSLI